MNRLKDLLNQKIERVQLAEIQGTWNKKTIETETEFLLLVKQLIEENETFKFEQSEPEKASETVLRDKIIQSLLVEIMGFRTAYNTYMVLPSYCIEDLIEYRKLKINGTKSLTKIIIKDYYNQDLKTAPEFIKEHIYKILNHLEND